MTQWRILKGRYKVYRRRKREKDIDREKGNAPRLILKAITDFASTLCSVTIFDNCVRVCGSERENAREGACVCPYVWVCVRVCGSEGERGPREKCQKHLLRT